MMDLAALLPVLPAAVALIGLAFGAMALGQRLSGRCLRGGTCGGRGIVGPDGEDLSRATYPNRKASTKPPAPVA
jgi:hypothetical protein